MSNKSRARAAIHIIAAVMMSMLLAAVLWEIVSTGDYTPSQHPEVASVREVLAFLLVIGVITTSTLLSAFDPEGDA